MVDRIKTKEQVTETLLKQLELLSECSKKASKTNRADETLVSISHAMAQIANELLLFQQQLQ